jgi:hypothetical protein
MYNEKFEGFEEELGELEEPIRETKEKVISFRIDDETYKSIVARGEKPNEWARKLVVSEAAKEVLMTAGERILFEEIARLRFLTGNGFKLLAAGKLTGEGWAQVLGETENNAEKIAELLLKRRQQNVTQKVAIR